MTPLQRRRIPFVGIAIAAVAGVVYLGITAMQGGSVVNIPLPGAQITAGSLVTLLAGVFAKRLLEKLDTIGEKVDAVDKKVESNSSEFNSFRATVETVLMDVDQRGGLVNDVRELQSHVFRDGGLAPRGVPSLQFPPSHSKAMP